MVSALARAPIGPSTAAWSRMPTLLCTFISGVAVDPPWPPGPLWVPGPAGGPARAARIPPARMARITRTARCMGGILEVGCEVEGVAEAAIGRQLTELPALHERGQAGLDGGRSER